MRTYQMVDEWWETTDGFDWCVTVEDREAPGVFPTFERLTPDAIMQWVCWYVEDWPT